MKDSKDVLKEYFGEGNLRLAFERYKRTADGDAKDHSGIKIFESNLKDNIKDLSLRLLNGLGDSDNQFNPIKPLKFYIPKKTKGSIRTYTLLFIEEAIIYQAIVDKIASDNYKKLNEVNNSVFSYRLVDKVELGVTVLQENKNYFFFEKWQDWYPQYLKASQRQLKNNKNQYRLETDISGFYDTVLHSVLFSILEKEFSVPKEIINVIGKLLNIFSGTPDSVLHGIGLPQGPLPSHFLAQLMLYQFDLEIIDQGYASYMRYVDDIQIFAKKENDLYKAKTHIESKLKNIGLYMNSKKTDIRFIGTKDNRKNELQKLKERLFTYISEDENIDLSNPDKNDAILEFDIIDGKTVFSDYERLKLNNQLLNKNEKNIPSDEIEWDIYLKQEISSFESLIYEKNIEKLNESIQDIKLKFYNISSLKEALEGNTCAWKDIYLEKWILLYEHSLHDISILNILNKYYVKTKKLQENLLYVFNKYHYLEWVQHKIAIILSSKEFNFSTNELSDLYRDHIDKLTNYSRLSFYLIFLTHLDIKDSLFVTIKRRLKEDDKELFYFKDWIIFQLEFMGMSNDELASIVNLIEYE